MSESSLARGGPELVILAGAFLALAVFVGGLAAFEVAERLRAFREKRLKALEARLKGG